MKCLSKLDAIKHEKSEIEQHFLITRFFLLAHVILENISIPQRHILLHSLKLEMLSFSM